jgi:hypothetical protein
MEASEPAESLGRNSGALQIGQNDALGITHHHMFNVAVSVHQNPDLAIELVRQLCKLTREFLGDYFSGRNAPLIELLETTDLAGLKSVQVSVYISNNLTSSSRSEEFQTPDNTLHQKRAGFKPIASQCVQTLAEVQSRYWTPNAGRKRTPTSAWCSI